MFTAPPQVRSPALGRPAATHDPTLSSPSATEPIAPSASVTISSAPPVETSAVLSAAQHPFTADAAATVDEEVAADADDAEAAVPAVAATEEPAPVPAAAGAAASAPAPATRLPSLDLNDEDSGAQCLICLHPLLEQQACALRCGHVYHGHCFQSWLLQKSRGECPQCKQVSRADELRMLNFEMGEVIHESLEEVLRIEAFSEEQRTKLDEDLAAECAEAEEELKQAEEELAKWSSDAQELKRQRIEVVMPETRQKGATLAQLREELSQRSRECTKLRTELDAMSTCQRKGMTIPQVQDGDEDLAEEKRMLRGMRPAERAKKLHESLVHARRLEEDMRRQLADCLWAAETVERDVKKRRQQDSRLRRQLSERHSEVLEAQQSQASSASSVATSSTPTAPTASPPSISSLAGAADGDRRAGSLASDLSGGGAAAPAAPAAPAPGMSLASSSGAGRVGGAAGSGSTGVPATSGSRAALMALPGAGATSSPSSSSGLLRGGSRKAVSAAGANKAPAAAEDDADFLYGGPARKTTAVASGHLLARAGMSAPTKAAPSAVLVTATPGGRRVGVMQKLFSGRKA